MVKVNELGRKIVTQVSLMFDNGEEAVKFLEWIGTVAVPELLSWSWLGQEGADGSQVKTAEIILNIAEESNAKANTKVQAWINNFQKSRQQS